MDVDVEAMISLSASLDCLTRAIQAEAEERARSTTRPQPKTLVASKAADASGNAVLSFEACPQGQWWALRRLWVGGVTAVATATGSAVVFTSTSSGDSYNADVDIPFFDAVDLASSLPNVAFYDGDKHLSRWRPTKRFASVSMAARPRRSMRQPRLSMSNRSELPITKGDVILWPVSTYVEGAVQLPPSTR